MSITQSSGLSVIRGFKCIEVNVETILTFRIVYYIVGDCCREANHYPGFHCSLIIPHATSALPFSVCQHD